jgi:transcription initiation factor TFIID subunit 9B
MKIAIFLQWLTLENIRLAIQSRVNYSFTQPPPREVLLELAHQKNNTPLRIVPSKFGVVLPPDDYCLTAPTYQVEPRRKQRKMEHSDSLKRDSSSSSIPSVQSSNTSITNPDIPKVIPTGKISFNIQPKK